MVNMISNPPKPVPSLFPPLFTSWTPVWNSAMDVKSQLRGSYKLRVSALLWFTDHTSTKMCNHSSSHVHLSLILVCKPQLSNNSGFKWATQLWFNKSWFSWHANGGVLGRREHTGVEKLDVSFATKQTIVGLVFWTRPKCLNFAVFIDF